MHESQAERREHPRHEMEWPACLWAPKIMCFFRVGILDISQSGIKVKTTQRLPLDEGDEVELNIPRGTTSLVERNGQWARIKRGRVVRIEADHLHSKMLYSIQFIDPYSPATQPDLFEDIAED